MIIIKIECHACYPRNWWTQKNWIFWNPPIFHFLLEQSLKFKACNYEKNDANGMDVAQPKLLSGAHQRYIAFMVFTATKRFVWDPQYKNHPCLVSCPKFACPIVKHEHMTSNLPDPIFPGSWHISSSAVNSLHGLYDTQSRDLCGTRSTKTTLV